LGDIEVLKEAGFKPGKDIKIFSNDRSAAAFAALIAGELNATIECNPFLAPQVYEPALKALNCGQLPKYIPSEEGVFCSDMPNLAEIAKNRRY